MGYFKEISRGGKMWADRNDCHKALTGVVAGGETGLIQVEDEERLRGDLIDQIAWCAVHHNTKDLRDYCRWLIRSLAAVQGVFPASIHDLYMAMGRGEAGGFTTPAINVRGLTMDVARSVIRAAESTSVGALIFEIARSEIGYTEQRPDEYLASVLAAAIKEGYKGPIFIQGDHFQINAKKFSADPDKEVEAIFELMKEAIQAGFYNIDIDSSTLVDLDQPVIHEQQRLNFEKAAELTHFIRQNEPDGVTVSVGGEVGEVGGKNTTIEEAETFIENFDEKLSSLGENLAGISKLSIQTGTSHGGVVLPDGTMAQVSIDFDALRTISDLCRTKYGLSGAVQHGASTLPEEAFDQFVKSGASEVHLATAFQNMIYERLPKDLFMDMRSWVLETFEGSRKEGDTDEQLFYKERKRAFGPFKRQLWDLPSDIRAGIRNDLENRFVFLFEKLNVVNTRETVDRIIRPIVVDVPLPSSLT